MNQSRYSSVSHLSFDEFRFDWADWPIGIYGMIQAAYIMIRPTWPWQKHLPNAIAIIRAFQT